MSLKHVDLESALRRLADRRIEEAMREGKFDNLPGAGKPLDLEPMPADENARMTWWMLRIMKGANFTPEEVRWRRQIDTLKDELGKATTEQRVEVLVKSINGLVHQLNTLGTNAINIAVAPVSLEAERRRLRERLAPPAEPVPPPAPAALRLAARKPTTPQGPSRPVESAPAARDCRTTGCLARNPGSATFCRKCGKVLPAA